jgi:hypothetical protein
MPETQRLPATTEIGAVDPSTVARRRSCVRVSAELICLLCGRPQGMLESGTWPPQGPVTLHPMRGCRGVRLECGRLYCVTCGGQVVATDVTSRRMWLDVPVDWKAERPRRGRPPKWMVAQRSSGPAAQAGLGRLRLFLRRPVIVPLLHECEHVYRDWKNAEAHCQVRIYAGTERSQHLPVVILTELADNDGPSITNTVEQIAAEVLIRYLPEQDGLAPPQDGLAPPFVLVERYPDRQPRGVEARWHDPFFGETFDLVTLDRWSPRRGRAVGRRVVYTLGTPDWHHVDRAQVEELIGEALPWPACTCQAVAPSAARPRGGSS